MELLNNYQILPLFSSPVYSINLANEIDINFWCEEVKKSNLLENYYNSMSENSQWLDNCPLKNIIKNSLKFYFYEILCANPNIEIFITDSWANVNKPGEKHHRHNHPNSIISGVFYLDTDEDTGSIVFNSSQYSQIEFSTVGNNIYNSKTWSLNPTPGTLLLFPSSLEHSVTANKSTKDRVSVAFNSFIKGSISKTPLARLKI